MKKNITAIINFVFAIFFIYVLILNVLKLEPNNLWYIPIILFCCVPIYFLIKKLYKCNNNKILKITVLVIQVINF